MRYLASLGKSECTEESPAEDEIDHGHLDSQLEPKDLRTSMRSKNTKKLLSRNFVEMNKVQKLKSKFTDAGLQLRALGEGGSDLTLTDQIRMLNDPKSVGTVGHSLMMI